MTEQDGFVAKAGGTINLNIFIWGVFTGAKVNVPLLEFQGGQTGG